MPRPGTLSICVPNYRGWIEAPHHESMLHLFHGLGLRQRKFEFVNPQNTILTTARQCCVNRALENEEVDRVLFIDDDMVFGPEQFFDMEARLVANDWDYVCAMAYSNSMPAKPCIFGKTPEFPEDGPHPWWHIITDYPRKTQFEVYASGFGMVLMTKRLLDGMRRDKSGKIIPDFQHFKYATNIPANEDVAFGLNARKSGFNLWCDSATCIGHISKERPIINEESADMYGDHIESGTAIERRTLKGLDAVPVRQHTPRPITVGFVANG